MNNNLKSVAIIAISAIIATSIYVARNQNNDIRTQEQKDFDSRIEADRDDGGYDYDCSDFKTRQEALDFFRLAGGPRNDPYGLDGDEDGVICENFSF